jgi:hypothetical protein
MLFSALQLKRLPALQVFFGAVLGIVGLNPEEQND